MGDIDRKKKIERILEFVKEHMESTATGAVFGRILGRYGMEVSDESLRELRNGLNKADDDEVDSLYTIIS